MNSPGSKYNNLAASSKEHQNSIPMGLLVAFLCDRLVKNRPARRTKKKWLVAVVFTLAGLFIYFAVPPTIPVQSYSKVLYAQNGELLGAKIASDEQWRFPSVDVVPEKYQRALIEFEDRRFYEHSGISLLAIARAIRDNIDQGRVVSGGSTITMQLARMLRSNPSRTYFNKAIEALIAVKLELHFSKQEILKLYSARAPFGGNIVGLNAASWRYFNRYPKQLSWAEAALLAVLPNSPALINIQRSRDKLLEKRNRLLDHLYQQKLLDKNTYEISLREPIPDQPKPLPQIASHLLSSLVNEDKKNDQFDTNIDLSLQQKVDQLTKKNVAALGVAGINNLSLVVINHQTMAVEAYIGNATFEEAVDQGPHVDIARRPRSTGSILKPFLYASMLEQGELIPNQLVADIPSNFAGFTPENFDRRYRGAVRVKDAIVQSLNIPTVRLLQQYGVARFYDDLQSLGLSSLFRAPDEYGLSLILGGAEASLWEVTRAYAWLTAQVEGEARELNFRQTTEPELTRALYSPGTAWVTLNTLLAVSRPDVNGYWQQFSSSQKIAWKTGTSYGLRDAWAVGSNGKYTVGVWAGNANGEGVAGLSGLKSAAPTMFQVFDLLGASSWIEKPEQDLKRMYICRNDGFLQAQNCAVDEAVVPRVSHFQKVSQFNKKIMLDKVSGLRVHGGCEKVTNIEQRTFFVLPPIQEFYWKSVNADYFPLPPWRSDCLPTLAAYTDENPMDIVYPYEGTKIYVPLTLNGERGRTVFKAYHRDEKAKIYWHVDDQLVSETDFFHEVELNLVEGWHKLVLIDQLGFRRERWFKIINKKSNKL